MSRFPLTDFICAMLPMPVDKLTRADPTKLAARYQIPVSFARGYLALHTGQINVL